VGDIWVIERWWGDLDWERIMWSYDNKKASLEECIAWVAQNEFILYEIHNFRIRNIITGEAIPAALFA